MKKIIIYAIGLLLTCTVIQSCKDSELEALQQQTPQKLSTRGYETNDFDWENSRDVVISLPSGGTYDLPMPWIKLNISAVPKEWIDPNWDNPDQRIYTRKNGWVLVYSNINDKMGERKYFALYNKGTGILRFFFYDIASESASSAHFAFLTHGASRLLNFTASDPILLDQQAPYSYQYLYTPVSNNQTIGYLQKQWYGVEFECAYDPDVSSQNSSLDMQFYAENNYVTQITGTSTGSITGTITSSQPTSGSFSLDISKNSYINTSVDCSGTEIGKEIKDGAANGDSFWTSVKSNIEKNLSKWIGDGAKAGVEEGVKTIFSSGGNLVADALSGFAKSITGASSQATSKVDLKLQTQITLNAATTQILPGFGEVDGLPLPGSPNSTLLYNQPLGVWNITTTPTVVCNIQENDYRTRIRNLNTYIYTFTINPCDITFNPNTLSEYTLSDKSTKLLVCERLEDKIVNKGTPWGLGKSGTPGTPYGYVDGIRLYSHYLAQTTEQLYDIDAVDNFNTTGSFTPYVMCQVSFTLTSKTTGEVHKFSKILKVNVVPGTRTISTITK